MNDVAAPPSAVILAEETYRPRVHYTAAETWINDPNGLVYADGVYHLFFQNNPFGRNHANLSWGHAVSRDLRHWEDRPLAIACDEEELIFSGSAVLDEGNTAGFGAPGSCPLVAIYTSHYTDTSSRAATEAQSLAYSLDGGLTWAKYEGNPVLERGSSDFRDPKVFRYTGPEGDWWLLAAVEAVDRKVVLYRSEDLKTWRFLSEFTSSSPVGRIWECPDLFPLPVDGNPDETKWVLIISLNLEEGDGGSASIVFIGDFDGVAFTPAGGPGSGNPDQPEWEWLDYGRDYYAGVSFNNVPGGRRILMAWMNNWDYARTLGTTPWRGAMALPREVTLHRRGRRLVLQQKAFPGPEAAGPVQAIGLRDIPEGVHPLSVTCGSGAYLLEAAFDAGTSAEFGLLIRQGGSGETSEATRLGYDTERGQLILDRNRSSRHRVAAEFASKESAPVGLVGNRLVLQIYMDTASVEAFAQNGLVAITDQIFPCPSSDGLSLYSSGGAAQLISFRMTPLKEAPVARPSAAAASRERLE